MAVEGMVLVVVEGGVVVAEGAGWQQGRRRGQEVASSAHHNFKGLCRYIGICRAHELAKV